jgi:hypothetical protein
MAPLPVISGKVARDRVEAALSALIPDLPMIDDVDLVENDTDRPADCFPAITLRQFVILAAIADGSECPRDEIRKGPCSDMGDGSFAIVLGLLARKRYLARRRLAGRVAVMVAITPRGLTVCRAFAEFVGSIVASLKYPDKVPDVASEPARPPLIERRMTGFEESRLLARASPQFALAYQAAQRLPVAVRELVALEVTDVDLAMRRLRVAGRGEIAIDDSAWQILQRAIRGRTAGPVFVRPNGRPWTFDELRRTFRRLRAETGLPPEVRFVGHGRQWGAPRGRKRGV